MQLTVQLPLAQVKEILATQLSCALADLRIIDPQILIDVTELPEALPADPPPVVPAVDAQVEMQVLNQVMQLFTNADVLAKITAHGGLRPMVYAMPELQYQVRSGDNDMRIGYDVKYPQLSYALLYSLKQFAELSELA